MSPWNSLYSVCAVRLTASVSLFTIGGLFIVLYFEMCRMLISCLGSRDLRPWCKLGARSLTIDPACIYLSIGATCRFWDTCVVARAVKIQGLTYSGSDLLQRLGPGSDINLWPTNRAVLLLSGTWWDSEVSLHFWAWKAERSGRLKISWNCELPCLKPCKMAWYLLPKWIF